MSPTAPAFPEPTEPHDSRAQVLLRYLDFFRAVVIGKVDGLADDVVRSSRLPSGWTPIELVKHLTYVELRWLVWGFEGESVPHPWGDRREDRWYVAVDEPVIQVVDALRRQGERTREVVEAHDLAEHGQPGPRWDGAEPPTLERVLLHLLQEYARHAGHLDVVRELIDRTTGEA